MPDLRADLESSLGPRFDIIRELGGGGMSRVFLAREVELDRQVVVKVVPPETAGVNLARFRRETQTAARLHHPHIVPLHASGEAAGALFYTMPFVDGETLRSRISSSRQLPVDEVVRVMRDVADALAYAHQHQVAHRDIKPENVLLSSGHALVTDFGIAKALSTSVSVNSTNATASGLAVGTPAYMAPEQAAGDPTTDHRADLYALGLLGYEMLTGKSPFPAAKTPQEMIAAHIAEVPKSIEEIRGDIPALLASLIMRCLEKRPDKRPPSAAVIREQLDAMRTPSGGTHPALRMRRRSRAFAAAAVLIPVTSLLLIAKNNLGRAGKPALDANVVAVTPFRVNGPASLGYLREGMLDLFAAKLTGEGGPRAADPRSVLRAWKGAAGSDSADLSREAALSMAEGLGAGQLLLGEVSGTAERLQVTARLVDVHDGRLRADAQVSGPPDSLAQLVDAVTANLLAIRAGEGARLSALTSTSLPALRAYLSGKALFRKGRYRAAGDELERAINQDTTFALAAVALMETAAWYGYGQAYFRAGKLAYKFREKLSPRDRALLEAELGPRYPQPSPYAEGVAAAARYRDLAPDRVDAWFDYGDFLMHYGMFIGLPSALGQAEAVLGQAIALDSGYMPALEHMVLLVARRGDTAATRRYARLYLAADSLGESALGVRWRLAVATGDHRTADSITSITDKFAPTSNSIVTWMAMEDGVRVPQSLERMRRMTEREVAQGMHGSYISLHDVMLWTGRPKEARAMLDAYEKQSAGGPALRERIKDALTADADPAAADSAALLLRAEWSKERPAPGKELGGWMATQCLMPLWQTMAHRDTSFGRRSLTQLRAMARDTLGFAGFASTCALIVDAAHAVVSQSADARDRVTRADSAMRSGPANVIQEFGNVVVARLWERIGDNAQALAAYRRRMFFLGRKPGFGTSLREEGRLAALTGDTAGAVAAYQHFLALREPAEASQKKELDAIRLELGRLARGESTK